MQSVAYFSILLAFASLALASSQATVLQQSNGPAAPVQVESVQQAQQPQQSHVVQGAPIVHATQPEQQGPQVVEGVVPVEHQIHHHHQQGGQHYAPAASYYAPAGLIQVVGEQQQQPGVVASNKPGQQQQPQGVVRAVEQYGQPEPAALPPNYKPFGSWGLYIGGNPADGYYTDYYKQLGSSVEKQQQQGQQAGDSQAVKPTSALSPLLRQASGASGVSPFAGGDYYPFAYSVNELSSPVARNYQVVDQSVQPVAVHHQSPVHAGAQVYGSPASFESNHYGVSPYSGVESYAATKRLGYAQQKEVSKAAELPLAQQPAKGYHQSRVYVGPLSAPVAFSPVAQPIGAVSSHPHPHPQQQHQHQYHHQQQQHQQQQQVVAYPVPVASQIVGSQAGVDGAFAPYGVHAFTRYAVKPTVVSGVEQTAGYHYGVSSQLPATYKQQAYSSVPNTHYYPSVGYYGYPLNQLHYSQGSIVPAVHGGEQPIYHSPSASAIGGGSQVEASEKSEASSGEDKSQQVNKQQQKRA